MIALLKRDLRLSFLRGAEALSGLFFFLIILSLFPFAFGGGAESLRPIAAAAVWMAALLASLLSLEGLYHRDAEDGTLDLLLLSRLSPFSIVAGKMLSHFLVSGLPLMIVAAPAAMSLYMPSSLLPVFVPSLFLGTLYSSLIGGAGAVLTMGARRPALLLAVIVFPLYLPMLILGMLAAEAGLEALPAKAYLLLQAALCLGAAPLLVFGGGVFLSSYQRSS